MDFSDILSELNGLVWGPPMLILLVGTGIFLTIRLKFLPWINLGYAIKSIFKKEGKEDFAQGDISSFQSLMTALAATIGTGNIVGVATAMVSGGPGALVWMWLSAMFGLSTTYGESVLAIKYRERNSKGEMAGGPMYTMKNGIKIPGLGKLLAILFSFFTVMASFGIGNMTQANSISQAISNTFAWPAWYTGLAVMILVFTVLIGGIKNIGRVCSIIVPLMGIMYFLGGIIVIAVNFKNLPAGIIEIFRMAFSVRSVAGGMGGTITATIFSSMRWGISRGVFSNEAGLGSAPIAAAAARTDSASRQGYINMTGTFFDTMIICSITGLVIASSGVLGMQNTDGSLITGVELTIRAFSTVLGQWGGWLITIGIAMFAFATLLGWEYYGEKALEYLCKKDYVIKFYRLLFCLVTYVGSTKALEVVWNFSDTMNGLMIIPNLICLLLLSGEVARECFDYQSQVIEPGKKRRK